LVLLDDVVVALGAGVAVASLIVVVALLSRYRALVKEATRSADLAKNVWDSMNSRLTTQDTRIVDLMARLDVYSVRRAPLPPTAQSSLPVAAPSRPVSRVPEPVRQSSQLTSQAPAQPVQSVPATKEGGKTQPRILQLLKEGPKTAIEINAVLGVTREHMGRLMKQLYVDGLVTRSEQNKPYVYELTDAGRRHLEGASA
jgi:DNA-binding transcriptional ArsR family regulator